MSKWISQIFEAAAAEKGGVVRRSIPDVIKNGSVEELEDAVRDKNFHLVLTGEQAVIICNDGDVRLVC